MRVDCRRCPPVAGSAEHGVSENLFEKLVVAPDRPVFLERPEGRHA